MKENLSHEILTENVFYDSVTGTFVWNKKGKNRVVGKAIGRKHNKGYWQVWFNGNFYMAHRLAWFYVYKKWPTEYIDHINENKIDNRIENLRDVSHSVNLANQKNPQRNNTSGYRGVSYKKRIAKFHAQIFVNKKYNSLGYFDSAEEAHKAYLKFKEQT